MTDHRPEVREALVLDVYKAIHALHKSSTLERCWMQDCDCEKIWKAIKAALSAPPIEPVGMRECHLGPDHIEHDITCGGPLSHPAMRECLESAIELISEAGPLHWAFHPYEKVAESAQAWEKKAAALLQQAHAALAAKEAVVDTALRENAELVKDKQVLMTGISVAQQAIKELYAHRDTLHAELAVATANADAYRLSMDEAHAEAMRDKAELARVREALEAHEAWAEAEHGSLGTFHQRMELCNYAEWLTEKVLAELRGEPFNKTFEGVPRLLIEPGTLVVNRIVIDEEQAKKLAQAALAAAPVPVVDEVVTVDGVYCFKDVMAPVLEKTKAGDSVRVVVYKL